VQERTWATAGIVMTSVKKGLGQGDSPTSFQLLSEGSDQCLFASRVEIH